MLKKKGGKCLSKKYTNAHSKLTWKCKFDHVWQAAPLNIKKGKWCKICAGLQKGTIEQMNKIANYRGGKCLSEQYEGAHIKIEWQCKNGHIWFATPGKVKQGRWCPTCREKPIKIPKEIYNS